MVSGNILETVQDRDVVNRLCGVSNRTISMKFE